MSSYLLKGGLAVKEGRIWAKSPIGHRRVIFNLLFFQQPISKEALCRKPIYKSDRR